MLKTKPMLQCVLTGAGLPTHSWKEEERTGNISNNINKSELTSNSKSYSVLWSTNKWTVEFSSIPVSWHETSIDLKTYFTLTLFKNKTHSGLLLWHYPDTKPRRNTHNTHCLMPINNTLGLIIHKLNNLIAPRLNSIFIFHFSVWLQTFNDFLTTTVKQLMARTYSKPLRI